MSSSQDEAKRIYKRKRLGYLILQWILLALFIFWISDLDFLGSQVISKETIGGNLQVGEKKDSRTKKYTNRLAREKSPYLLQHANNPVDWYPWGKEAFDKAKKENRPIFLSIGYSTCHWCHVMEEESFENEEIAGILNQHFVAIKVDREERPDVDNIYMQSVMAMTGSGGWPLSVFLTPDKKPFYGGTYFPPEDRYGRAGFKKVLLAVSDAWQNRIQQVLQSADSLTGFLQKQIVPDKTGELSEKLLETAFKNFSNSFDSVYGGFGNAPKFHSSHNLSLLLRIWNRTKEPQALQMVEKSLQKMAFGGIYDHLGGGFHRYSTDARWLVPHFEKMLYDQATLSKTYLEAYQVTGNTLYADVARGIFSYVLRDMTDKSGGFYSAEDADSEGEEGKFYVWRAEEIKKILGEDQGDIFSQFYDITDLGNFEHQTSILNITIPPQEFASQKGRSLEEIQGILELGRKKLFSEREKRVHPHKDDKILTDWNGLMISALAYGYQVLGEKSYLQAAQKAADFVLDQLQKDGKLLKRYRDGEASINGYLDDYAFFIAGLIDLYEAGFEVKYLKQAVRLTNEMLRLFWDASEGGFFFTGNDSEELISRTKEIYDGALPSGNSIAALNLLRIGRLTMNTEMEKKALELMQTFSGHIQKYPTGYSQMLIALDFYLGPTKEIVLSGVLDSPDSEAMLKAVYKRFLPRKVLAFHFDGPAGKELEKLIPFTEEFKKIGGKTTVYVCENYVCQKPINDIDELVDLLRDRKKG